MRKIISFIVVMILLGGIITLFLPAIPKRQSRTSVAVSISNLKQIGIGCIMHAKDADGAYPDDWSHLQQYFSSKSGLKVFVTPKNRKTVKEWNNVMNWTDYVYIRGTTIASSPARVVAFLPPGHHTRQEKNGAIVLFADNHVEWQSVEEFTITLNKTPTNSSFSTGGMPSVEK